MDALAGACQSVGGKTTTEEIYGSLIDETLNRADRRILLYRLLPSPINNYPLINCDRRDHSQWDCSSSYSSVLRQTHRKRKGADTFLGLFMSLNLKNKATVWCFLLLLLLLMSSGDMLSHLFYTRTMLPIVTGAAHGRPRYPFYLSIFHNSSKACSI